MKNGKRFVSYILFFMFIFVIAHDVVNAEEYSNYINPSNAEIECIYANGIVIGLRYDQISKKASAYVEEYPISKTVVIDGDPITNISLFDSNVVAKRLESFTCPANVHYWIAWEIASDNNDSSEKNKVYKGVYAFDWCTTKAEGCNKDKDTYITKALESSEVNGWWIFSSETATGGTVNVTSADLEEGQEAKPEAIIPLVGERIYIIGDIPEDAYKTHNYKSPATEATGKAMYAQFIKVSESGKVLLKRGKTITSFDVGSSLNSNYICVRESMKEQDSSRADSSYKFSSIRNEAYNSDESTDCNPGYVKYERTTESCKPDATASSGGSFCERYSNTAIQLMKVVEIMQILVPGLVLVFTGVEITRIVLAGNIEEELPKRRKSIIIRFIIMIVFLFLPTIISLFISLAEGVNIADVSCLFNGGKTIQENSIDCVPED